MKSNKSHKKIVIFSIIGGVLLAAAIAILLVVLGGTKPNNIEKFELSSDLYGNGQLLDITAEDFNQSVSEKKSFLVMAHLAVCPAEMPLTDTSKHLAKQENLTIYSIDNDEFKKTELSSHIKYLPSMAIYHNGELITFLDAESNEDLPYYKTPDNLKTWIEKYVNLR